MSTMNELFSDIENALDVSNLVADGQTDASNYRHTAREALAVLWQRVADLEAFYQHMVDAGYQDKLIHTLNAEVFKSGLNHDAISAWSDYHTLLERLKANGE